MQSSRQRGEMRKSILLICSRSAFHSMVWHIVVDNFPSYASLLFIGLETFLLGRFDDGTLASDNPQWRNYAYFSRATPGDLIIPKVHHAHYSYPPLLFFNFFFNFFINVNFTLR
jgi:hypothetical protein